MSLDSLSDKKNRSISDINWKDITKVFIVAIVLDTVYQIMVLQAFYVVQALIVAGLCAIVPYVLFRGPTTRLAHGLSRKQAGAAN